MRLSHCSCKSSQLRVLEGSISHRSTGRRGHARAEKGKRRSSQEGRRRRRSKTVTTHFIILLNKNVIIILIIIIALGATTTYIISNIDNTNCY